MKLKVHDKCPILSQKYLSLKSASNGIFTGFVFLATCLQATAATNSQNLEYNNLLSSVNYSETFSNLKLAQNDPITITGKVLDEAKLPLPGASVVLKKGNVSATTNASGEFSITIPEAGGVLVFNFIGYEMQEVPVTSAKSITVSLRPSSQSLNEVVVIGYGTQKKANVTGAMATLKPDNLIGRAHV